jgi:plastocyanin
VVARVRSAFVACLVLLAASGCLAPTEPETEAVAAPGAPSLSSSHPAFAKLSFTTNVTSPTDPIDELLGRPHEARDSFDVEAGTGEMRVSLDVQPAGARDAAVGDIKLQLVDPSGKAAFDSPLLTKAGKMVVALPSPACGEWVIKAAYRGLWTVGAVVVSTPVDYTPGIVLNVSYPEQTEVEHAFYPKRVTTAAGSPTRITLYDYDPHAGIDNLQHNVYLPALDARTEGQTTWGEVRTLDFTAPSKPGEYEFYCEYHKSSLKGTLTVV